MQDDEALLKKLVDDEDQLVFSQFSMAMAHELGMAFMDHGKRHNLPCVFDVTRAGQCLFHCALEGATLNNVNWVERKKRVVNHFAHSSMYMGTQCRLSGQTLEERYALPEALYAAHGGCFPILIKDTGMIGTVTVSGLPQLEDHELVVKLLKTLL